MFSSFKIVLIFYIYIYIFSFLPLPPKRTPSTEGNPQSGPCEPPGPLQEPQQGRGPAGGSVLGYAVLLLEQGVLCVLPILWAALLFSEASWDFWTCCVPAVSPRHRAGEGGRGGGGRTNGRERDKMYINEKMQDGGIRPINMLGVTNLLVLYLLLFTTSVIAPHKPCTEVEMRYFMLYCKPHFILTQVQAHGNSAKIREELCTASVLTFTILKRRSTEFSHVGKLKMSTHEDQNNQSHSLWREMCWTEQDEEVFPYVGLISFCFLESISRALEDKAEQTQQRTFWLELKPLTGLLFRV